MKPSLARQTLAIVAKDLKRELRTKEVLTTTVAFSVLLVVIFAFSFYRSDESTPLVFPGILWIAIIFAGTLAIERSFIQEKDSGCLRALALIPGTHLSLYLGKLVINLLYMAVFEAVLLPVLALAFDIALMRHPLEMSLLLVLGTVGFAAMGTLVSAMLVHHRLREVMVPLLLYPLLVPLVIFGVQATGALMATPPALDEVWGWLRFMAGVDVVLLVLAPAMFRWVLVAIE